MFHLGTFADGVPGLYAVGVLHPSVSDAWSVFDQLFQLAAADAHATLTGANAENMRRIREDYRPDLKADFPFIDVRRNVNQADVRRFRAMIAEAADRFGVAVPDPGDACFYADQLVRHVAARSA
ncbi:Uncharacterised protein [Mycobacteroides abscessus subsp. abscessus]|nr:Uncharacterised protein [Mycobacteroides abscessus subsp. abscessus]